MLAALAFSTRTETAALQGIQQEGHPLLAQLRSTGQRN
jgi:hypothetical protein